MGACGTIPHNVTFCVGWRTGWAGSAFHSSPFALRGERCAHAATALWLYGSILKSLHRGLSHDFWRIE
jgi:hypothetical protein